jgi:translation elongation factor EF-1beta
MIIGEDFIFRDDLSKDKDKTVPIELTSGPYKGVVYRYDIVKVKEQKDGSALLFFEYQLYERPKRMTEKKLRNDKKFTEYLGLVLNRLILEVVDGEKAPETEKISDEIVSIQTVEDAVEVRTKESQK